MGWYDVFFVSQESFIACSASLSNDELHPQVICIRFYFPPYLQVRQLFAILFSLIRLFILSACVTCYPTSEDIIFLCNLIMYLFRFLAGLSAILVGVAALPQPMPAPTPVAIYDIVERAPEPTLEARQGDGCSFQTCVTRVKIKKASS